MFSIKIQSNFTKFFVAVLLVLFVTSRAVSMLHAFSHQEKEAVFAGDSVFAKLIFSHEKSSDKKSEHCSICSAFNSHNQSLISSSLVFFAAFLLFVFALRKFDRVKLSYLLSSQAPRAPPVIS
jgi:hypothetical protein